LLGRLRTPTMMPPAAAGASGPWRGRREDAAFTAVKAWQDYATPTAA
jgi:hypothetical protein